jgi:hypothetical protein
MGRLFSLEHQRDPGLFPKLVALQRTVKEAGTLGRCPVASFPHTYRGT